SFASTDLRPVLPTPISTPSCPRVPTPSCCRRQKAAPMSFVPMRSFWRVRRSRVCPRVRSRSWRSRPRPRPRCFSPVPMAGGASARLEGLTWGAEDLSAELGAQANRDGDGRFLDPYRLARALCLAGAAAARVQAIDTVTVDFRNAAALRRETEEARRDGFTGKMAIHPAQVPIINEVFTPSAAALAEARAVIAAFEANPERGTVGIDGVMYDRPHLERARQLLARATAAGLA